MVLIVTAVEIVGLVRWLELQSGGELLLAAGTLLIFLLLEHIISQIDQTGKIISGLELLEVAGFSIIEVVVRIVWLLLIPINGILALVFFLGALFVEHQITDNVKKRLGFFHFSSPDSLVFLGLVIFTISEVVGASLWLSQGSLVALIVGSTVEHYVARNVGQISEWASFCHGDLHPILTISH